MVYLCQSELPMLSRHYGQIYWERDQWGLCNEVFMLPFWVIWRSCVSLLSWLLTWRDVSLSRCWGKLCCRLNTMELNLAVSLISAGTTNMLPANSMVVDATFMAKSGWICYVHGCIPGCLSTYMSMLCVYCRLHANGHEKCFMHPVLSISISTP